MKQEGFEGQRTIVLPEFILNEVKMHPVNQVLYITDIGYYPNAKDHYRIREEGCEQYILMYSVEGSGWISIEGQRINVKKNQYFTIPKNTPHSYGSNNSNPWTIYWVHFTGTLAPFFIESFSKAESILPSKISRIEDRILLFEEIIQNLEMGYSMDNINYANICLLHFLGSFRYLSQFRQVRKAKEVDMVESSILFMKESIAHKITLEELAFKAGLSPSHYSITFKKKTGRSPLDYLIHLKIQQACQYFDHTQLKIKEVAKRVGYDDPYYFSRIFKKIMNMSPVQYRKLPKG